MVRCLRISHINGIISINSVQIVIIELKKNMTTRVFSKLEILVPIIELFCYHLFNKKNLPRTQSLSIV